MTVSSEMFMLAVFALISPMKAPLRYIFKGIFVSVSIYAYILIDFYLTEVYNKYPVNSTLEPTDFGLDIYEYLDKYKYPWELHNVSTDDGYILGVHRIKKGESNNKPVVLIWHCFLFNSQIFVYRGPGKSLGLMLADNGWDVWLGNNRGNIYSRSHLRLDPDKDPEFWDFSLNEFGEFDLPATIDYIRMKTGEDKIYFIGYSQGNLEFFYMASSKPEYNNKVELMISFGPSVYLTNVENPLILALKKLSYYFLATYEYFGIHEPFFVNHKSIQFVKYFCQQGMITVEICRAVVTAIGLDPSQHDKDLVTYLLNGYPSGTSLKMISHLIQLLEKETFSKYDHGKCENVRRYNSTEPPNLDISSVTVPTVLYYSTGDTIISLTDAKRVIKELPNVVRSYLINRPKFGHLDYVWARDIDKLLYHHVVGVMNRHFSEKNEVQRSKKLHL